MDRRRFLLTSLAGAASWPFADEAQPAGKVYRLGVLTPGVRTATPAMSNLLPLRLREDFSSLGSGVQMIVTVRDRWWPMVLHSSDTVVRTEPPPRL